jgi:tetratricopeptide (TPR) repeat protein
MNDADVADESPLPAPADQNERRNSLLSRAIKLREAAAYREACAAFAHLTGEFPDDAEIWFQAAWAHDNAGLETEAAPFYERALALPGLPDAQRADALLGLGSTYRVLGRSEDAMRILQAAVDQYPANNALRVFQAMAEFDSGSPARGFATALTLLVDLARDETIEEYRRPIVEYAAALKAGSRSQR